MRPAGEIIAPDEDRLAAGKDVLVLGYIAYLVIHGEAGAANMANPYPNLYSIRAHQRQHIGTCHFFDEYTIVSPVRACLDARIVRRVRDNALDLLMLLTRRPLIEPGLQVIEVVASCFLEVGKVDGIIDVCQGVKVAEANLYGIPARKLVAHRIIALSLQFKTNGFAPVL